MDRDEFTLAVAGDVAPSRRLFPDSDGVAGVLRSADAALANLEAPVVDECGPPSGLKTGMYLRTPPSLLDDLTSVGFDCFATASNHTADFLWEGIESTMAALEERDIPYAGLGRCLETARSPAYLDTPSGRLGLVAATNELDPGTHAGQSVPWGTPRPGVAPLRTTPVYQVSHDQLDQLEAISEATGLEAIKSSVGVGDEDGQHMLLDVSDNQTIGFVATDDDAGVVRKLSRGDVEALVARVEQAAKRSDVTVASLHVHAGADGRTNDETVPPFLEIAAHKCVEAGADAVVCHGPHVLRGIETFEGAPIFYSLGDFAMQYQTIPEYPAEMYATHGANPKTLPAAFIEELEDDPGFPTPMVSDRKRRRSVLPVCRFEERLTVDLYPLDVGVDEPMHRRGRPEFADEELAAEILDDLEELSSAYGTTIERTDGKGVLRVE